MANVAAKVTMRMWVSFLPDRMKAASQAGFTLLEVLVVLVIISMAVAVIGPRLQNTYDSVTRSGERADVIRQLERLPLIAREKRGMQLEPGSSALDELLDLPEGWRVTTGQALHIEASGACHRTSVQLRRDGDPEFQNVTLAEPDCHVEEQ